MPFEITTAGALAAPLDSDSTTDFASKLLEHVSKKRKVEMAGGTSYSPPDPFDPADQQLV